MKLSQIKANLKSVESQTPEEEEQLRNLGWSDRDIENMKAKQVEMILKRKTRKRKAF
jgi:hypothetical protein